jgi:RimJ/RimL family protein N-acetyltransferase
MCRAGTCATLTVMNEHAKSDSDERMLMPRSAPPAAISRVRSRARSAAERAARADRTRDELELATLEAQLRALDADIHAARRTARRAAAVPELGQLPHPEPPPRPHGEHVRLRDGAQIVVREVEPEDAPELRAGFQRLSAVTRYRRFLTSIDRLSAQQVSYLTHLDHTFHEAIGALDAVTGDGIGIARYVCDVDDPRHAEVAVVVVDAWQGRGVGTALFERLVARSRAAGIERITARTIVGNEAARRLLAHAADTISEHRYPGAVLVTARLRPTGSSPVGAP